jgi:hypothetical protein
VILAPSTARNGNVLPYSCCGWLGSKAQLPIGVSGDDDETRALLLTDVAIVTPIHVVEERRS